jgi:hypothetical protein
MRAVIHGLCERIERWKTVSATRVASGMVCMLLSTGCSEPTGACLQTGFEEGLRVQLSANPHEPFRIEVRFDGSDSPTPLVYECMGADGCFPPISQPAVLFPVPKVETIHVTVRTASASVTKELRNVAWVITEQKCRPPSFYALTVLDPPA